MASDNLYTDSLLRDAHEPTAISWSQRVEEIVRFPTAVVLQIVNNANVPADVLEAAKSEVDRIYRDAGIRVLWQGHKEEKKDRIVHLTIVIVPDCVNENTCRDKISTGVALGDEGLGARRAYILFNRIREVACKLPEMLTSKGQAWILGLQWHTKLDISCFRPVMLRGLDAFENGDIRRERMGP